MNRRAFLTLLGLGTAGLVTADVPTHLVYEPQPFRLGPVYGAEAVNIDALTRRVFTAFIEASSDRDRLALGHFDGGTCLGDTVMVRHPTEDLYVASTPVLCVEQVGLDIMLPRGKEYSLGELDTFGQMMAREAKRRGVNVFGNLRMPGMHEVEAASIIQSEKHRAAMRGLVDYDIVVDAMRLRFDLIGGRLG